MAPKWLDESKETELQNIIQKLTTTGKRTLDEGQMKKLKNICKLSDEYVNCAYYSLMTQLRKDHAEIRYSALLIINELFVRSSLFRSKLESDIEEFLELVVETDPENPLPLPLPAAKALKIKGLECTKNWASKYGEKYIRLRLALSYLQKCKKMDFDDMLARSAVQRQRDLQEQERADKVMKAKILKVQSEMDEVRAEISGVLTQMENCFKLLLPHADDLLFTAADFDSAGNTELGDTEPDTNNDGLGNKLRHHGIFNMTKMMTVEVNKDVEVTVDSNEDTSPIIDNLKDLEKQISSRYYPMAVRWQKILMKVNNSSAVLKEAINTKALMKTYLDKCKELKIKSSKNQTDSDEDDDFEEVKEKEGYEETVKRPIAEPQPSCSKVMSDIEQSYQWKMKLHQEDIHDPTTALSNINKRFKNSALISPEIESSTSSTSCNEKNKNNDKKSELLEKAPVLPYDIDLYHWEEEKPLIPEKVRFDSLHKFWETKDDDTEENEALMEAQVASLRTRKIDFSGKFEPVKWACRAPLPNGKLCPRKDRFKCPFHGKVIPRDSLGNPSDGAVPGPSKESSNSVPDWQDPQLLKDIEAATGIDLKIPVKKGKGKGKQKKDGLTNINKIKNTVRERLSKKIMKRYRHYAKKLDDTEKKRFNDKFGDQWNYY